MAGCDISQQERRVNSLRQGAFTMRAFSYAGEGQTTNTEKKRELHSPTIWFKFCCDCGPEGPGGGGPLCGGMAL
jgi:hypothetical protein